MKTWLCSLWLSAWLTTVDLSVYAYAAGVTAVAAFFASMFAGMK